MSPVPRRAGVRGPLGVELPVCSPRLADRLLRTAHDDQGTKRLHARLAPIHTIHTHLSLTELERVKQGLGFLQRLGHRWHCYQQQHRD
jgi:hypothetical protein